MFIHMKSTRHTAVGTLRRGMVYNLPDNSSKAAAIVKALSAGKNPALVLIKEEDASAHVKQAISIAADDLNATSDSEEMASQLSVMTEALEKSESARAALEAQVSDLSSQLAEASTNGAKKALEAK
ncbi:hypothetical protein OE699_01955 [Sedimentimonas flavescens]|uniref:Uncharacterized protein n=1 Tax=Sedimentimonas flavescens TaxID=2851012 RepID=A0ABT2ZVE3_9RHOB|nr:hypothetical protein [Sedimentimonas flavescens]MCV2877603.1 hypothetical protein [Sedimentimonas flavescens]